MAGSINVGMFMLPSGSGTIIMWSVFILAIVGVLGWMLWRQWIYRNLVYIKEVRNGTPYNRTDKYKYTVVNNTDCIKLLKSKAVLERPPQDYIRRLGNRDVIEYVRAEDSHYYPRKLVDVNEETIGYKVSNRDADYWASMRTRMAITKWSSKSILEMYSAPLSVFLVAIIFIIGMWVFWNGMSDVIAPIGKMSTQLAKASNNLAAVLNQTQTGGIIVR